MIIRKADIKDMEELVHLWMGCFDDAESYIRLFYRENFSRIITWVVEEEKEIIGMAHLFPAEERSGAEFQTAKMLYALGVKENKRGHGVATSLIRHIQMLTEKEGESLFLEPETEKLADYYRRLGFQYETYLKKIEIQGKESGEKAHFEALSESEYEKLRNSAFSDKAYVRWPGDYLSWVIADCRECGGWAEKLVFEGKEYMVLAFREGESLIMQETTLPIGMIERAADVLKKRYQCKKIEVWVQAAKTDEDKMRSSMAFNSKIDDPYVNLMLM